MSQQHFEQAVQHSGVYLAALMAACAGVPMAQVQLWLRNK